MVCTKCKGSGKVEVMEDWFKDCECRSGKQRRIKFLIRVVEDSKSQIEKANAEMNRLIEELMSHGERNPIAEPKALSTEELAFQRWCD